MQKIDCVVVGGGWYGLAAAKQYRFARPDDSLVVFESASSLGGTWADHRLYPGLKSNNLLGTYEYPDFPMDSATFAVKKGEHITGEAINAYLKAYSKEFGIADLIQLNTKVTAAEHQEGISTGGWVLTIAKENEEDAKVFAHRLILATGLTSEAFLPHFKGEETFGGPVFHGKDFQKHRDTLQTAKSVTVLGGSKFCWDAVYAYVTAGVQVDWVIRSSGHGPSWMSPPYVTPLKKWIEPLANTRLLTWFSPCIWGEVDGYSKTRGFLHRTAVGRLLVKGFWGILGGDVLSLCNFDAHPETAKLKPWIPAMYAGASFSILNYETDFLKLIRESRKVRIHVDDITHLSAGAVHLANGTVLESQALLAHTGWKQAPAMKFLPEGIECELGLPHSIDGAPIQNLDHQLTFIERADKEILKRFPGLSKQPLWNTEYVDLTKLPGVHTDEEVTPYTLLTTFLLHRFIVPTTERLLRSRDLAYVGMVSNFSNSITAHLQGLWVAAYFSGALESDPPKAVGDRTAMEKLQYEAMLYQRFGKWRYPIDWGTRKAASFIFDAVPYLDLLQRDLGLNPHRKRGRMAEIWMAYGAQDYRTVNEEWQANRGNKKPAATE